MLLFHQYYLPSWKTLSGFDQSPFLSPGPARTPDRRGRWKNNSLTSQKTCAQYKWTYQFTTDFSTLRAAELGVRRIQILGRVETNSFGIDQFFSTLTW